MTQWGQYPSQPLVRPGQTSTAAVFGKTMSLVAFTTAFFAGGAFIGRALPPLLGILAYVAAFIVMLVMNVTRRANPTTATGLLFAFGALMGVASGPTLGYYAGADPTALAEAGVATALFMAGLGAIGYGSRRDLSMLARICSWALLGLIVLGIVMVFVRIPGGSLLYSVLGLAIFAGLVVVDFQRLRRTTDTASAPYLAVSIFLDALNVFWFFLRLFTGGRRD